MHNVEKLSNYFVLCLCHVSLKIYINLNLYIKKYKISVMLKFLYQKRGGNVLPYKLSEDNIKLTCKIQCTIHEYSFNPFL